MLRRGTKNKRGVAMIIVVLTIVALALLATPFLISMRLHERSSRHAVARARARYAATASYNRALSTILQNTDTGSLAVSFSDLPNEFKWTRGSECVILSAKIEDDRGKLDLNRAPQDVLHRLVTDVLSHKTGVETLAGAIATSRASKTFASLDELSQRGLVTLHELNTLQPHLTVNPVSGENNRVNFNTATTPVLRAMIAGLTPSLYKAAPGSGNTGNGSATVGGAASGVVELQCIEAVTDPITGVARYSFLIEKYAWHEPLNREIGGTYVMTISTAGAINTSESSVLLGLSVVIKPGTVPFDIGDTFRVCFDKYSYSGNTFMPERVDGLLRFFRANVAASSGAGGTYDITVDDAASFPNAGTILIGGAKATYQSKSGNVLVGCAELPSRPAPGEMVALFVPDLNALNDRLLDAASAGEITEIERITILTAARDTSFFFQDKYGRYTIDAMGVVNDPSGKVLDRLHIRSSVQIAGGSWVIDKQEQFDQARIQSGRGGLVTLPEASYMTGFPPASLASAEPAGVTLRTREDSTAYFNSSGVPSADSTFVPGRGGNPGHHGRDNATLFVMQSDGVGARLWVRPDEDFDYSADHVFFDSAVPGSTADQNRVRIFYSREGKLVLQVSCEAMETRSARWEAAVNQTTFRAGTWHLIEAYWPTMFPEGMALLLNGRPVGYYAPAGVDAERTAEPPLTGEKWFIKQGNYYRQQDVPGGTRGTIESTSTLPAYTFGYSSAFTNQDVSTRKAAFNHVHLGGATLSGSMGKSFVTKIKTVPPATFVASDALLIPVEDASGFPEQGYVKINNEIVRYTGRTDTSLTVHADGRGADLGDNLATQYNTDAAEHLNGTAVVCISIFVSNNSDYPMPQILTVPGEITNYFGIGAPGPGLAYVQLDDEWISYTHRGADNFLVNVQASSASRPAEGGGNVTTSSMRAQAGTLTAEHNASEVKPVYITAGGVIGTGDRVTLLDDLLTPQDGFERVLGRIYGVLVTFTESLPAEPRLTIKAGTTAHNARMMKFPSSRRQTRQLLSFGAPLVGAGARADAVIGYYESIPDPGFRGQRIKTALPAEGFDCMFGPLAETYAGGEEWAWADYGQTHWPTTGYARIGTEAVFYKLRYPQGNNPAQSAPPQPVQVRADILGTGDIVWTKQFDDIDPILAGFNPYGGYITVSSKKRVLVPGYTKQLENCNQEILLWLISEGHLTWEKVNEHGHFDEETGIWSFDPIEVGDSWTIVEYREVIKYDSIEPQDPGADEYTFRCADGRHLFNTHMSGVTPLGHAVTEDGQGGQFYPTINARTMEMTILQRGALGTTEEAQQQGSPILLLKNIPATLMTDSIADDGDAIPVETTSGFPAQGYLEISDGTRSEIILYTSLGTTSAGKPAFKGVKRFRGRFGTTPVDLSGLAPIEDYRDTSAANIQLWLDPRRIVRLVRPPFDDKMPLEIVAEDGVEESREYVPFDASKTIFFEATRTVRGAKWLSVDWTADLPEGTELLVLARLGGSPDWEKATPVQYQDVTPGRKAIYKFTRPISGDETNAINASADTITIRVFYKFKPGYRLDEWQRPVLKSLTVRYESAPRVLVNEVLEY